MSALPAVSLFNGATTTEGDQKTFIDGLYNYLVGLLGTVGTKDSALAMLGAPMNGKTDKSGAYTVVSSDRGKVFNCTGAFTLSLTAAATLGDGFVFGVCASTGIITIDPSGSELIDGSATRDIAVGKTVLIYCDGTRFLTVGDASTLSLAAIVAALGYTPAHADTSSDWVMVKNGSGTANLRDNYGYGIYYVWSSSSPSTWTYGIVIICGGVYGMPDYPSIGMTSGGGNVPVVIGNIGFTGSGYTSGNVQKFRKL